jgi:hypothetical protein
MFDDLRSKGSAFEDDQDSNEAQEKSPADMPTLVGGPGPHRRSARSGPEIRILGMTAGQRLVIAFMLFLNVSVLGCFLLIATQAVVF